MPDIVYQAMKIAIRSSLVTLFFLSNLYHIVWAESVQIKGLRSHHNKQQTRLVFDLSAATIYHVFSLNAPDRLAIDFVNAKAPPSWPVFKPEQDNPMVKIRSSQHGTHILRVVVDLKHAVKVHSFSLPPQGVSGHRVVVDLSSAVVRLSPAAAHSESTVKHSLPEKSIVKVPAVTAKSSATKKSLRDVIVVIDPGHGGKDPGAMGAHRVCEKDVVLNMARHLKIAIDQHRGMRAILTRHNDYYIGLRQRIRLARRDKADLFVSIHADAYANKHSHGASVYALSARGASSEAARWLAEKENQSELLGGADLADKDHILRSVLLDLSQTATISASLELGEMVLSYLSQMAALHHPHVEQAGFAVLKSPDIPSILVETGFLSNPSEARKLSSLNYQKRLVSAIVSGIDKFLRQHPPVGTHYYKHWQQVS